MSNLSHSELVLILKQYYDEVSPGTKSDIDLERLATQAQEKGITKLFASLQKKFGRDARDFLSHKGKSSDIIESQKIMTEKELLGHGSHNSGEDGFSPHQVEREVPEQVFQSHDQKKNFHQAEMNSPKEEANAVDSDEGELQVAFDGAKTSDEHYDRPGNMTLWHDDDFDSSTTISTPALNIELTLSQDGEKITISLLEGASLPIRDEGTATSDPFVEFILGNGRNIFKTDKVKKSLNPKWKDQKKTLSLTEFEKGGRGAIVVKCWDWDRRLIGGSHAPLNFIGGNIIYLSDLCQRNNIKKWLRLFNWQRNQPKFKKENIDPPLEGRPCLLLDLSLGHNKTHRFIKIRALMGANLPSMDDNGFSDPWLEFCTVRKSNEFAKKDNKKFGKSYKTSTQRATLMPMWNETIEVLLTSDDIVSIDENSKSPIFVEDLRLLVTAWDSDAGGFKSDFIGSLDIALDGFQDGKPSRKWYYLPHDKDKIKRKASRRMSKKGASMSSTIRGKEREELEHRVEKLKEPKSGPFVLLDINLTKSQDSNYLAINIIKAVNLPSKDSNGSSDPYFTVEIIPPLLHSKASKSTNVEKKTLAPVYFQRLTFDISDKEMEAIDAKVVITCFDWDRFTEHDFMGGTEILFSTIREECSKSSFIGWHSIPENPFLEANTLKKSSSIRKIAKAAKGAISSEERKELTQRESFIKEEHMTKNDSPSVLLNIGINFSGEETVLSVIVCRATDLPIKDNTGASDPYFTLILDPPPKTSIKKKKKRKNAQNIEQYKTSVKKQTLEPFYYEKFEWALTNVHLKRRGHLHIKCMDWDMIGSHDFMGSLSLPLHMILNDLGEHNSLLRWYELPEHPCPFYADEPMLKMKDGPCILLDFQILEKLVNSSFSGDDTKLIKQLEVMICRAANLNGSDGSGMADPYAEVHLVDSNTDHNKSKGKRTKIKKATLEPQWYSKIVFDLEEGVHYGSGCKDCALDISVWDRDLTSSNDFLGAAVLVTEDPTVESTAMIKFDINHIIEHEDSIRKRWYDLSLFQKTIAGSPRKRQFAARDMASMKEPDNPFSGDGRRKAAILLDLYVEDPLLKTSEDHLPGNLPCLYLEFGIEFEKEVPKLFVQLLEGKNLPPKDADGFSDPYVQFKLISDIDSVKTIQHQSSCERKTLNPVWTAENFIFDLPHKDQTIAQGTKGVLLVDCFDFDPGHVLINPEDDYIGGTRIGMDSIVKECIAAPLVNGKRSFTSWYHIPIQQFSLADTSGASKILHATVCRAQNLRHTSNLREVIKACDPCIKLKLHSSVENFEAADELFYKDIESKNGLKMKTSVANNTINPQYDEDDSIKDQINDKYILDISCWDMNNKKSHFIGSSWISVAKVWNSPGHRMLSWVEVFTEGATASGKGRGFTTDQPDLSARKFDIWTSNRDARTNVIQNIYSRCFGEFQKELEDMDVAAKISDQATENSMGEDTSLEMDGDFDIEQSTKNLIMKANHGMEAFDEYFEKLGFDVEESYVAAHKRKIVQLCHRNPHLLRTYQKKYFKNRQLYESEYELNFLIDVLIDMFPEVTSTISTPENDLVECEREEITSHDHDHSTSHFRRKEDEFYIDPSLPGMKFPNNIYDPAYNLEHEKEKNNVRQIPGKYHMGSMKGPNNLWKCEKEQVLKIIERVDPSGTLDINNLFDELNKHSAIADKEYNICDLVERLPPFQPSCDENVLKHLVEYLNVGRYRAASVNNGTNILHRSQSIVYNLKDMVRQIPRRSKKFGSPYQVSDIKDYCRAVEWSKNEKSTKTRYGYKLQLLAENNKNECSIKVFTRKVPGHSNIFKYKAIGTIHGMPSEVWKVVKNCSKRALWDPSVRFQSEMEILPRPSLSPNDMKSDRQIPPVTKCSLIRTGYVGEWPLTQDHESIDAVFEIDIGVDEFRLVGASVLLPEEIIKWQEQKLRGKFDTWLNNRPRTELYMGDGIQLRAGKQPGTTIMTIVQFRHLANSGALTHNRLKQSNGEIECKGNETHVHHGRNIIDSLSSAIINLDEVIRSHGIKSWNAGRKLVGHRRRGGKSSREENVMYKPRTDIIASGKAWKHVQEAREGENSEEKEKKVWMREEIEDKPMMHRWRSARKGAGKKPWRSTTRDGISNEKPWRK